MSNHRPISAESNQPAAPPNFLRNTLDALITLPREETIREDLQRVIERNRLIERVQEITSHVDEDVTEFIGRVGGAEYQRRTLADEIRDRGPGYAGYHRLKVRAVTDDLAAMLGQPSCVVDTWRRAHYSEQDPERSESTFLLEYDLGYRERRMQFLLRKLTDPRIKRELNRIATTLKSLRRPRCHDGRGNRRPLPRRFHPRGGGCRGMSRSGLPAHLRSVRILRPDRLPDFLRGVGGRSRAVRGVPHQSAGRHQHPRRECCPTKSGGSWRARHCFTSARS